MLHLKNWKSLEHLLKFSVENFPIFPNYRQKHSSLFSTSSSSSSPFASSFLFYNSVTMIRSSRLSHPRYLVACRQCCSGSEHRETEHTFSHKIWTHTPLLWFRSFNADRRRWRRRFRSSWRCCRRNTRLINDRGCGSGDIFEILVWRQTIIIERASFQELITFMHDKKRVIIQKIFSI